MNEGHGQTSRSIGWLLFIAGLGAIATTRFTTSVIVGGAAELLAAGTEVKVEPE